VPGGHRGNEFCGGRAQRHGNAQLLFDAQLHAAQRGGEIRVEAIGAGEVEIEIVERGAFHGRREVHEDALDAAGEVGVVLVLSGDDDGLGAEAQRVAETHGCAHAAGLGIVAGAGDHAAAHQHRLAAQTRVERLLDGGEEGVHVHVDDFGGAEARPIQCVDNVVARLFRGGDVCFPGKFPASKDAGYICGRSKLTGADTQVRPYDGG